jgi:hypothetical protein
MEREYFDTKGGHASIVRGTNGELNRGKRGVLAIRDPSLPNFIVVRPTRSGMIQNLQLVNMVLSEVCLAQNQ